MKLAKKKRRIKLLSLGLALIMLLANPSFTAFADDGSMDADEIAVPVLTGIHNSFKPEDFAVITTESAGDIAIGTDITLHASVTNGVDATFVGWFSDDTTESLLLTTNSEYSFKFTGEHVYPIFKMNYLFRTGFENDGVTLSNNAVDANFNVEIISDPTGNEKGNVLKVFTTNNGTWRTIGLDYSGNNAYSYIQYEPDSYYTLSYKVYVENVTGNFTKDTALIVNGPSFTTFVKNNSFASANSGVLYKNHYGSQAGQDNLKGVWRDCSLTFYSGSASQHEEGGLAVTTAVKNAFQILGKAGFTLYIDDICWSRASGVKAPASMVFEETDDVTNVYYDEDFSFEDYFEEQAYSRAIKYGKLSTFKIKDTLSNEYLEEVYVNGITLSADEDGVFSFVATEPLVFSKEYSQEDYTTEIVSAAKWPEARITTSENILHNKTPILKYGTTLMEGKSLVETWGKSSITNGVIDDLNMDIHGHDLLCDNQIMRFIEADGDYRPIGEIYLDITFNLENTYYFNELWIASNTNKDYFTMGAYEVYISDSQSSLYDAENLYTSFDHHTSLWSGVTKTKFLGEKTGKYLGIRITQGLVERPASNPWTSDNLDSAYARMRGIALLGVQAEEENEYEENACEISEVLSSDWPSDSGTTENILKRKTKPKMKYDTILDKTLYGIEDSGEVKEFFDTKKTLTDGIYYQNMDIYDSNLTQYNSYLDKNERLLFLRPDGSYRDVGELYLDITYDLGGLYKLNEFWFATNTHDKFHKVGAFEIYVSDSVETLYNSSNLVGSFDSHTEQWSGIAKLEFLGEKYGSALGIRITQGMINKFANSPWTAENVSESYARMSAVALFGESTVEEASFAESDITLVRHESAQLITSAIPATANQVAYWTSADETVATVTPDGVVTGEGSGTTTLTGILDNYTFTCDVTCQYIPATDVVLSETNLTLHPFDAISLADYVTVLPENSTNKELYYYIDKDWIAEVDENTGELYAKSNGTALIRIFSESGIERQINLTVEYDTPTGLRLYIEEFPIYVGERYKIHAKIEPVGANQDLPITFGTVTGPGQVDEFGYFYTEVDGLSRIGGSLPNGRSTTFIVSAGYKPVEGMFLNTEEVVLYETGQTSALLRATVLPDGANPNVIWKTSDKSVATVENGVVCSVRPGKAIITAISEANPDYHCCCYVTVLPTEENPYLKSGNYITIKNNINDEMQVIEILDWEESSGQNLVMTNVFVRDFDEYQTFKVLYAGDGEYTINTLTHGYAINLIENSDGSFELKLGNQLNSSSRWYILNKNNREYYIVNKKHPTECLQLDNSQTNDENYVFTLKKDFQSWEIAKTTLNFSFNLSEIEIELGETSTALKIEAPSNFPYELVSWNSENTDVVTVNVSGELEPSGVGFSIITAKFLGKEISCKIWVVDYPDNITLNESSLKILVGENKVLTSNFEPNTNLTYKVNWKSSDKKIATVNAGMIEGKRPGTVKITASARGLKATCTVKVVEPSAKDNKNPFNNAIYRIENALSGNVLSVYNSGQTTNSQIVQSQRHNGASQQQFRIIQQEDNSYKFVPMHTEKKVLGLNSEGEVVILKDDNKNIKCKRWFIKSAGNGNFYIVNKSKPNQYLTTEGIKDIDEPVLHSSKNMGSTWKFRGYEIKYDNYFDNGMLKRWEDEDGILTQDEMIAGISHYMNIAQEMYSNISVTKNLSISYDFTFYTSIADTCNGYDDMNSLDDQCSHYTNHNDMNNIRNNVLFNYNIALRQGTVPVVWTGHICAQDSLLLDEDPQFRGLVKVEWDDYQSIMTMNDIGDSNDSNKLYKPGLSGFTNNDDLLYIVTHEIAHTLGANDTYCRPNKTKCANVTCSSHHPEKNYDEPCLMGSYDLDSIKDKNYEKLICFQCQKDVEEYLIKFY